MVALTRKEILAALKKLGIITPSEFKTYFQEYRTYYTLYINSLQEEITPEEWEAVAAELKDGGEIIRTYSSFKNHNNNDKNSYKERRLSKRILVVLEAEFISSGKNYTGSIGNLSENGLYMITAPIEFTPATILELSFQPPSGEALRPHCKIKWSFKTPPHGLTKSIGMEIIDPPPKYKEFLKTL